MRRPEVKGRARFGEGKSLPQPELVSSWRASFVEGTASERADGIIRSRDLPLPLLDVLARTVLEEAA